MTASAEVLQRARELAERRLSREEAAQMEAVPVTNEERDGVLALVRWFCRRYPTPAERFAYVRRAYARWHGGEATRR